MSERRSLRLALLQQQQQLQSPPPRRSSSPSPVADGEDCEPLGSSMKRPREVLKKRRNLRIQKPPEEEFLSCVSAEQRKRDKLPTLPNSKPGRDGDDTRHGVCKPHPQPRVPSYAVAPSSPPSQWRDAPGALAPQSPMKSLPSPFEERFCVFAKRGARRIMEDQYTAVPAVGGNTSFGYYAVFDGHHGRRAADFASQQLHLNLLLALSDACDIPQAIISGFKRTDEAFLEQAKTNNIQDGCTAVATVIKDGVVFVGWVGDSRAILASRKTGKARQITADHTPDREDERTRIEKAGGILLNQGTRYRVHGRLAVSRALGNLDLKKWIIGVPEVFEYRIDPDAEEYLLLATDGVWQYVEPQLAADVACNVSCFKKVARSLTRTAYDLGSLDDQACIVVDLNKYVPDRGRAKSGALENHSSPAAAIDRLIPPVGANGGHSDRDGRGDRSGRADETDGYRRRTSLQPGSSATRSSSASSSAGDSCASRHRFRENSRISLRRAHSRPRIAILPSSISVTPAVEDSCSSKPIDGKQYVDDQTGSGRRKAAVRQRAKEGVRVKPFLERDFVFRGPGLSGSSIDFTTQSSSSALSSPPRSLIRTRRAAAAEAAAAAASNCEAVDCARSQKVKGPSEGDPGGGIRSPQRSPGGARQGRPEEPTSSRRLAMRPPPLSSEKLQLQHSDSVLNLTSSPRGTAQLTLPQKFLQEVPLSPDERGDRTKRGGKSDGRNCLLPHSRGGGVEDVIKLKPENSAAADEGWQEKGKRCTQQRSIASKAETRSARKPGRTAANGDPPSITISTPVKPPFAVSRKLNPPLSPATSYTSTTASSKRTPGSSESGALARERSVSPSPMGSHLGLDAHSRTRLP